MHSTQDNSGKTAVETERVIELVRKGDSSAFNLLAQEYEGIIAAKASLAHTKGVDFEDLLQEGYVALFNAAKTFTPEAGASFKTYASVCIGNRISSIARDHASSKNRPFQDYSEISDDLLTANSDYEPEFAVFARDRMDTIFQYISVLLSETENRVLTLCLSGRSYSTIAKELKISEKSVDNALQRARRKLKAALDKHN